MALANLNAALATWVAAQTAAIEASVVGEGCSPVVSEDFTNQALTSICEDGGVTITWTITDLCSTTTTRLLSLSYRLLRLLQPTAQDLVVDACDYDNDVPAVALANLNAALATWVAAQTAAIEASVRVKVARRWFPRTSQLKHLHLSARRWSNYYMDYN